MGVIANTLNRLAGRKTGRIDKNWVVDVSSPISSSPTAGELGNGQVGIAFGTQDGTLYLVGHDAQLKWHYRISEKIDEIQQMFLDEDTSRGIYAAPTMADINKDGKNEILVGCDLGTFFVLDATGKLLWSYKTKGAIRSAALVCDINADKKQEIIFGSNDKNLYVLDGKGTLLWSFKAASGIESPPAILPGKRPLIVFGSNDGTIYAIDAKGKPAWNFKTQGKITAAAAIASLDKSKNLSVIIGSADKHLYALSEQGKLLWRYQTEGRICSTACLADINNDGKIEILFGSCDDRVYCLSHTGSKLWSFETDFWVVASPMVMDIDNDGKPEVIVGSYDSSIYVLDAEGTFLLDYLPGVSAVAQQPGHANDALVSEPGNYVGKKIWEYKTEGMIIGSAVIPAEGKQRNVVVGIKTGKVDNIGYKKE